MIKYLHIEIFMTGIDSSLELLEQSCQGLSLWSGHYFVTLYLIHVKNTSTFPLINKKTFVLYSAEIFSNVTAPYN